MCVLLMDHETDSSFTATFLQRLLRLLWLKHITQTYPGHAPYCRPSFHFCHCIESQVARWDKFDPPPSPNMREFSFFGHESELVSQQECFWVWRTCYKHEPCGHEPRSSAEGHVSMGHQRGDRQLSPTTGCSPMTRFPSSEQSNLHHISASISVKMTT